MIDEVIWSCLLSSSRYPLSSEMHEPRSLSAPFFSKIAIKNEKKKCESFEWANVATDPLPRYWLSFLELPR